MSNLYFLICRCVTCDKVQEFYYNRLVVTSIFPKCCGKMRFDDDDSVLVQENVDWCVLILEEGDRC